jgi:hypothetical protein
MTVDDFIENAEEISQQVDDLEEDGTITLNKGNAEELLVLMLQDIKLDLKKIKDELDIDENEPEELEL